MQAAENIAASISVSTNFLVVDAVAAAYENGARAGGSGRRKNALKVSTKHNETKRQKMDQDDKKPPKKSGANQKVHSGDKDKASGVEVISLIDNSEDEDTSFEEDPEVIEVSAASVSASIVRTVSSLSSSSRSHGNLKDD
jgi:hypothetical protein